MMNVLTLAVETGDRLNVGAIIAVVAAVVVLVALVVLPKFLKKKDNDE